MATTTDTQFTADKWAAADAAQKASNTAGTGTNPNATLDKDAFMKLLLTELQYQDPTDPMDTASMLEQTSQLASLEMQENTNKIMQELATQMQSSYSLTAMSALGKIANLSNSVSKDTTTSSIDFSLYFKDATRSGQIEVYDTKGNVVKTIDFGEKTAGVQKFTWDGTDKNGDQTLPGEYLIKAKYTNVEGNSAETLLGTYPVEAVKFENGEAKIKIAGEYVSMSDVREFTEAEK